MEGGKRDIKPTEQEAIIQEGGMGFITYLAHQEDIDTFCPEPDRVYEQAELLKQFSREESQYYYFARVVGQWNRKQDPKPDFEVYMKKSLERDKKTSEWNDFDFSIKHMKEVHASLFNTVFKENDSKFFDIICNPTRLDTVINKVARVCNQARDEYSVKQIQKYMNEGYSIYAQFGATHVVMQEPLLKEVLNK